MVKGRQNHRVIQATSNCWRSYDPYDDHMSFHPFFLRKYNVPHQGARPPYKLLKLLVNFKQVCQCKAQKDTEKLKILWKWVAGQETPSSIHIQEAGSNNYSVPSEGT